MFCEKVHRILIQMVSKFALTYFFPRISKLYLNNFKTNGKSHFALELFNLNVPKFSEEIKMQLWSNATQSNSDFLNQSGT